ncbi:MAG: hypothetical protein AAF710_08630 [Planctomycetota bacterium]
MVFKFFCGSERRGAGGPGLGLGVAYFGLGLALAVSAGCVETRVVGSSWDDWREMADPPRDDGTPRAARGQAYAVELGRFDGPERLKEAYAFAGRLRAEAGLAEVWFMDLGAETAVYAGRYPRRNHPDAKAMRAAVRAATLDGHRPFRRAELVPLTRGGPAERDAFDLSRYSGYRTLLLGVYEPDFAGGNHRAAAEAEAARLRAEYEIPVYYYHGPNQSIVAAGLFTQADFVVVNQADAYGPAIRQLQEVFPHARRNGETITNPELPTDDQLEPTVVVRVP